METNTSLLPVVRDEIAFDALNATMQSSLKTLSQQKWSDTEAHDPGVTLLEAFTYGVTDLAYRHTLPLSDLLTSESPMGKGLFPVIFSPENALTCSPVTVDDYRRALLDLHTTDNEHGHFYFRDAQLIKEPDLHKYKYYYDKKTRAFSFSDPNDDSTTALTLNGNYWLYLALNDEIDRTDAENKVNTFLLTNRNLGEAVSKINWLTPYHLDLAAEIELDDWVVDEQDVAQVLASIYQASERWCTTEIIRYTTQQLREKGMNQDAILEGPWLQHGWIPELPAKIDYENSQDKELNLLVNPLLAIKGVKSIRSLDCPTTSVPAGSYACLWSNTPTHDVVNKITLISKGGINKTVTVTMLNGLLPTESLIQVSETVLPVGQFRKPGDGHPVSALLPPCYGLQSLATSTDQQQLHQFMLPFEQMLDNGCQQLAKLPQLLSFDRESGSDVWAQRWPVHDTSPAQAVHQGYQSALTDYLNSTKSDENKEQNIINYLLGYFDRTIAVRGLSGNDEYLASQKYYLSHYAVLAAERSTIRADAISSLQKRIAARLGMHFDDLSAVKNTPGSLPFYLIEHRNLLPEMPHASFGMKQRVVSAGTLTDNNGKRVLKITLQAGMTDKLIVGQLVDLFFGNNEEIRCQPVQFVSISENYFLLYVDASTQLKNAIPNITEAPDKLQWCNSAAWLEDMTYCLTPVFEQGNLSNKIKRLSISPYPILMNKNDVIQTNISGDKKLLKLKVTNSDPINNYVEMEIQGDEPWPTDDNLKKCKWYFGDDTYVDKDRFSFVISLVFKQGLIKHSNDPYALEAWIKNIISQEVPAHITVAIHWMSDDDYQQLSANYSEWQEAKKEIGLYSFGLLNKLSLGHIPSPLEGINTLFIATDAQRVEAIGSNANDWHEDIIKQEQLFYVPNNPA